MTGEQWRSRSCPHGLNGWPSLWCRALTAIGTRLHLLRDDASEKSS